MNSNTILLQLAIALLLTFLAAIDAVLLERFVDLQVNLRFNLSLILLCYLGSLIRHNLIHAGRVILMTIDLVLVLICLLLQVQISTLFWLYPLVIWFNRSLLRYSRIQAILIDFTLCLLGTGAALSALGAGYGMGMALWCFLLVQSLHVMIPCRNGLSNRESSISTRDNFNRALQSAENALQQLMKNT